MILTSPTKVQTTKAPMLFLCGDVGHINIIQRLYDFTLSPTCPVMRNSRLKMASQMAIVHHNVPYRSTPKPTSTIPYTLYFILKAISLYYYKYYYMTIIISYYCLTHSPLYIIITDPQCITSVYAALP